MISLIVLVLLFSKTNGLNNYYQFQKNQDYRFSDKINSILFSVKTSYSLECINKCNNIDICLTCVFVDNVQSTLDNCFLYNQSVTQTVPYNGSNIFTKTLASFNQSCEKINCNTQLGLYCNAIQRCDCKPNLIWYNTVCDLNFMKLFDGNISEKLLINGYGNKSFIAPCSVTGGVLDQKYYYFVSDNGNRETIILNETFQYITSIATPQSRFNSISATNIYINEGSYISKRSFNLSFVLNSVNYGKTYYGITFDNTERKLYASFSGGGVGFQVFNDNLTLIETINTTCSPIQGIFYGGKLFVLSNLNQIAVLKNNTQIGWYTGICQTTGTSFKSVVMLISDYMIIPCEYDKKVRLYFKNGTNTGKYINTTYEPRGVWLNPLGQLVVSETLNGSVEVFF